MRQSQEEQYQTEKARQEAAQLRHMIERRQQAVQQENERLKEELSQ